ncbi:GTPase activating protein (GAP) for Rho1p [Diatrype stigma]|uniref:GTPase activating protein (GAP) for Rho1p n=1 Tax=Diatrype stigma TaxID=117547 RepID=A0AAN9UGJ9_9PEZI
MSTSPPQQPAHPPSNPPASSPPSKRDLKSWWKRFQNQSKDSKDSHATGIEGIFRLNGSEKRIKELKIQFDSPDRYGKGLVWDGYTVHDAANVLRRYLNDLPEPVVPLDLYERFREPLRGHTKQAVGDAEGTQLVENFDERQAIAKYQQLIKELPPLNRQLLLYILDLLAVFAAKADENRMTAQNLAAIFQPGMLSHPAHAMAPEEYRLNQCVIIFLIENQDHFLIGMQGTGTDEKTKEEIEKGTPTIAATPASPSRVSGVNRTASNSSAAAESVVRDGMIRRNRSTSSRHSRHSNGASTPNSPALVSTPTGGLARSNTVPSKKSPHIPSGRFATPRQDSPSVAVAPASPSPVGLAVVAPATVTEEISVVSPERSPAPSTVAPAVSNSTLMPGPHVAGRSQERLLDPNVDVNTPVKERALQNLFQRSPGSDGERRQPNKLRKKRIMSSTNPSAQSSTSSLPHSSTVSPPVEHSNPLEQRISNMELNGNENSASADTPSEPTPRASQVPSTSAVQPEFDSGKALKPQQSPPSSLHSSSNEGSDRDQVPEEMYQVASAEQDKDRKRWRLSRHKEDDPIHKSGQNLGVNSHAEMSTSTIGSGSKPRKSWTGESGEVVTSLAESETGSKEKDEPKGPIGWIKNKYREAKETAEQKRTKSPPADHGHRFLPPTATERNSDPRRRSDERQAPTMAAPAPIHAPATPPPHGGFQLPPSGSAPAPHNVPLPTSPPPARTTHEEPFHSS